MLVHRGRLFQVLAGLGAEAVAANDDDLLWIGERGPLRDRSAVFYMLKKYARRAELDPDVISPHILRHTFATRYLKANVDDLRGLAAILGHTNLNTVMIYTEPTTEDLAARMERAEVTDTDS